MNEDASISSGDLLNAILFYETNRDEAERTMLDVFSELESRVHGAGQGYPYRIEGNKILKVKERRKEYLAYIFCLLLSFFGWRLTKGAKVNPWLLFEDLSCLVAEQYLQGEVIKFGAGARQVRGFRSSITELAERIGEGEGFYVQRLSQIQDDGVDIVAWKNFADKRMSKLVLFGQCAAGKDWKSKLGELDPRSFIEQWFQRAFVSKTLRSFFLPHRLSELEWEKTSRRAGIIFERCRIAQLTFERKEDIAKDNRYLTWAQEMLPVFHEAKKR